MKAAISALPRADLPAWSRPAANSLSGKAGSTVRIVGILAAVGLTAIFWVIIFALVMRATGIEVGITALAGFGAIVAAWCAVAFAVLCNGADDRVADGRPDRGDIR